MPNPVSSPGTSTTSAELRGPIALLGDLGGDEKPVAPGPAQGGAWTRAPDRFRTTAFPRPALLGAQPLPGSIEEGGLEELDSEDPGTFLELDAELASLCNLAEVGDERIPVAVLDSGFDLDHPALRDNRWTNPAEVPGDGKDNDGNGLSDDVAGWDFAAGDADLMGDDARHGTHIAGLATQGTDRIALIPLQAFSNGVGPGKGIQGAEVAAAIDYAAAQGARVVNLSFKAPAGELDEIYEAMERHPEVLFVVAAGNRGADATSSPCTDDLFFKVCDLVRPPPSAVVVAAVDDSGELAPFSNYGAEHVSVAAPGVQIRSSVPGGTYAEESGTSMAAPQVAALAAKCLLLCPSLTPMEVHQLLVETSRPSLALAGRVEAGGTLDASKALKLAALLGLMRKGTSFEEAAEKLRFPPAVREPLEALSLRFPQGGSP